MRNLLFKVFRILPEEIGKLSVFILLAALLQAGMAVGISTADALFLSTLGAEKLPYVYLLLPLFTLLYAPIYSLILSRFGIYKLFLFTLLILIAGGIAFGLLFTAITEPPLALFYAAKIYSGLWFIALYTLFWNFCDDYFAVLDGKRLYGLIAAGTSVGGIIGAGLVTGLAGYINPGYLFFAWSCFALMAIPVVSAIARYPKLDLNSFDDAQSKSIPTIVKRVGHAMLASRFALCLALLCFFMVLLSVFLEYLSFGVLHEGRTTAELAQLLGKLYATAAVLTLLINLVFFSRVVSLFGVNNTALIVPFAFLGSFILFYLFPGFTAAVVAFYMIQSLFVAVEYNNINLLFNGLGDSVRKYVRTFIEAISEPLASALAGLTILYLAGSYSTDTVIQFGLAAGLLAVILAFFVRNDYGQAICSNLRDNWLDLSLTGQELTSAINDLERRELLALAQNGSIENRLIATEILWELNDSQANKALVNYLAITPTDYADRIGPLVNKLLSNSDNTTLGEILVWLETESNDCPPEILGEFLSIGVIPSGQAKVWTNSKEPHHRALHAIEQWHSPNIDESAKALVEIKAMLHESPISRNWGLWAIGHFQRGELVAELIPWIAQSDTETQRVALESLARLAWGLKTLPTAVLDIINSGSLPNINLLLTIVGKVGDTAAIIPVLRIANSLSPTERKYAIQALINIGGKATPFVVRVLFDTSMPYQARILAGRILARIAPPQFQAVADELISNEFSQQNFEQDREKLDFILEVLNLKGNLADLDLIRIGLNGNNPRDRANAVETIEQSVPRGIFISLQKLIPSTIT